jgi:hypothetical protein
MAPGDDEMELINAEFESMVANLNLDQSSPTTFLDDLDAINEAENQAIYNLPQERLGLRNSIISALAAIQRWWNRDDRDDRDDSDGAQV